MIVKPKDALTVGELIKILQKFPQKLPVAFDTEFGKLLVDRKSYLSTSLDKIKIGESEPQYSIPEKYGEVSVLLVPAVKAVCL